MSHIKIQSWLLIGKTGSGKSYHAKSILENDLKDVPMDNRFLISPTARPDMDDTLLPYFDEDNIQNEYDDDFIASVILELIKGERRELYEKFHFRKDELTGKKTRIKRPKGAKPEYPEYLVFVDDFIEKLKSGNKVEGLSAFITKARQYNVHLVFTSQYYTAVSPVIRSNIKNIHVFGTNAKEIKKLGDEHSIFDKSKDFKNYFQELTNDKYSYVIINYNYPANNIFDDNKITPKEFLSRRGRGILQKLQIIHDQL